MVVVRKLLLLRHGGGDGAGCGGITGRLYVADYALAPKAARMDKDGMTADGWS